MIINNSKEYWFIERKTYSNLYLFVRESIQGFIYVSLSSIFNLIKIDFAYQYGMV